MSAHQQALALALRHHEAGRLPEAEAIYQQILQNDPDHSDALHLLGLIAHQAGKHEEAVNLISKALEIQPDLADAYSNLGNALRELGQLKEAATQLHKALALKPDLTTAYNNLGNVLQDLGQQEEAIVCYRKAISIRPDYAQALYNLGVVLHQSGALVEAVESYQRALTIKPKFFKAHMNLGNIYLQLTRHEDAIASCRNALELEPDSAETYINLGNVFRDLCRWEEALSCYHEALGLKPTFAEAHYNRGVMFQKWGKMEEAMDAYRSAIRVRSDFFEAHSALGLNLWRMNKFKEAKYSFGKALALNPDHANTHNNLGLALQGLGILDEAISSYENALRVEPDLAEAHNNLGLALQDLCKLDDAVRRYQKAASIKPDYSAAYSNLLMAEQYRPSQDAETLYKLHCKWDQYYGRAFHADWPKHVNTPDPDRRLRVGLLSADFRRHPVGYFLVGFLKHLPTEAIERIIYCDNTSDDLTEAIKEDSDKWCYVGNVPDSDLASAIFGDRIDILVDLAGHSANNRLPVFSRKPAPVQVTWAGYPGTTGLSSIDYLISDQYSTYAGEEEFCTEKVVRMPHGWLCYQPPDYAPTINALPYEKNGFVTFASFNNPAKLNTELILTWCKVLASVANSRMLIKYKGVDSPSNLERLTSLFETQGISKSRFTLEGQSPHDELLRRYTDADIALDPFPYSGGLTTLEALWMGVPVITMAGETFAGRHSLSHLSNMGLQELVAHNTEQYVELSERLARHPKKLAALRAGLREQMTKSPICDVQKFANDFSIIMRETWKNWCYTRSP